MKVTAGRRRGEGIHVDAGMFSPSLHVIWQYSLDHYLDRQSSIVNTALDTL